MGILETAPVIKPSVHLKVSIFQWSWFTYARVNQSQIWFKQNLCPHKSGEDHIINLFISKYFSSTPLRIRLQNPPILDTMRHNSFCFALYFQQNFYEKPAFDYPMNQLSVWLMLANEGMPKNETFCSATPSAMIFGKSDGDRFAVTRDLTLKPGYVLQFKVHIITA